MAHTILFSEMIPSPEWEDTFHDWYDTEHIPIRMAAPGFIGAKRYREIGNNKYLAVYEMESPEALNTEVYKKIKGEPSERTQWMLANVSGFTRYTATLIGEQVNQAVTGNPYDAPVLYPVMFSVPEEREEEFNRWYEEDHVPTLLKNERWLACRRYKIFSGEPENWTHLALHYLVDAEVLDCEERQVARRSPWRAKLAEEDWFKGHYMLFQHMKSFTSSR